MEERALSSASSGADFHFQEALLNLYCIIKRQIVIYWGSEAGQSNDSDEVLF